MDCAGAELHQPDTHATEQRSTEGNSKGGGRSVLACGDAMQEKKQKAEQVQADQKVAGIVLLKEPGNLRSEPGQDQEAQFPGAHRPGLHKPWPGGAEKAGDESRTKSEDHQQRVLQIRIDQPPARVKERPDHRTGNCRGDAEWKKCPERFRRPGQGGWRLVIGPR